MTEDRPTLAEVTARWRNRSDTDPTWRTDYTDHDACPCGHPSDDHDDAGACMHLCDCAWDAA